MSQVEWERVRRDVLSLMSNGLSDRSDEAARAFIDFAQSVEGSIVPEPWIRSWLPERLAAPGWTSPMPWIPADFWPYEFQARAFDRLSVSGQLPQPTVIAAPDGAGKSECFLLPMLDHCARQRGMSRPGIKALVIYASRASASENAARVAAICRSVERFHDLRPGLLIDDYGSTRSAAGGSIIDSMDGLVEQPPDLLLTVPEMLERSIMSKRLHGVWADTTPASLRFVVVDDVHLYTDEGVEDLAVLLRRLGVTLGMASPTQPLAGAVPVITAGIHMDPLDLPTEEAAASRPTPTDELDVPDSPQDTRLGARAIFGDSFRRAGAHQPSSLPQPKVDVRQGASALPSLADTPTGGPDADPSRVPFGSRSAKPTGPPPGLPGLSPLGAADGDDDEQVDDPLLDLGHYLFGVRFGARSLVVGTASKIDELEPHAAVGLLLPDLADLADVPVDDFATVITALFGPTVTLPSDRVEMGQLLLTHPLIRSVVAATCDRLTPAGEVVRAVSGYGEGEPSGVMARRVQGLQRIMALLGTSQRLVGNRRVPLVRIEAQIEIHRSGRLVRVVSSTPTFAVADDVQLDYPSTIPPPDLAAQHSDRVPDRISSRHYLPAVACRNCGSSGWLTAILGQHHLRASLPSQIEAPLGQQDGNLAIMMLTNAHPVPGDRSVALLDIETLDIQFASESAQMVPADRFTSTNQAVAVELGIGTAAVAQRICPVCDSRGSVDLLGADDAAIMATVTRSMARVAQGAYGQEGRVLVLTTSSETVNEQLEGFTSDQYVDELRRQVVAVLGRTDDGGKGIRLGDLAALVLDGANDVSSRQQLIPDDLGSDPRVASLRSDRPSDVDLRILRDRIMFELATEFGHRAANADSLTTTGAARLTIRAEITDDVIEEIGSRIRAETETTVQPDVIRAYLTGLLEKLRANGAIRTPLLEQFIIEGGDPSFVAGQRPVGLRELVGTDRPRFVTTAVTSTFDSVTAIHQRPGGARTWLVEWACSRLGINSVDAPSITWAALEALSQASGVVFGLDSMDGHRVYGLNPDVIVVQRAAVDQNASGSGTAAGPTVGPHQDRPDARRATRLRTMSSVDASPLEKAHMEWQFKYGPPDAAPNVLYMSAGALRGDRDVMDTSIDLAAVDALIADVNAIGDLTSVPEVSRTGTRAGHGTIVWIGGRRRDDEVVTVDTEARLPRTPDSHRANEVDYLLFLFDRIADGTTAFDGSFDTMDQAMDVALALPANDQPAGIATAWTDDCAPSGSQFSGTAVGDAQTTGEVGATGQVPAAPPTPPPLVGDVPRPGFGPRSPVPVPDAPQLEKSVGIVPAEFTNEGKGLFEVMVDSSTDHSGPVSSFRRSIAVDHDDDTYRAIASFARSDIGPTLERIRSNWIAVTGSKGSGTTVGDAIRLMMPITARPTPTDAPAAKTLRTKPEHPAGWAMDAVPLRVHVNTARIRIVMPIMEIQGRARISSVAAALVEGLEKTLSSDRSRGVRLEAGLLGLNGTDSSGSADTDPGRGVWYIDVLGLSTDELHEFARPETIRNVLEDVRRVVDDAIEQGRGAAMFRTDIFGTALSDVGSSEHAVSVMGERPTAVSFLLAAETIDRILDRWCDPVPIDPARVEEQGPAFDTTFSDSALKSLGVAELTRGFELALATWLEREPDVLGSIHPGSDVDLELNMTFDGVRRRYGIDRDAVDESATYRIRPLSEGQHWPEVSLRLLDELLDPDSVSSLVDQEGAERRDHEGGLQWFITWSDISEFYTAAAAADAADVRDRDHLSATQRERISEDLQSRPTRIRVETLQQNPLALLLDLLARPYSEDWRLTADSILDVISDIHEGPTGAGRSVELAILQHHVYGLAHKSIPNGQ